MQVETNTKPTAPNTWQITDWKLFLRRLIVMNLGLFIMAVGINSVVHARLGASPWDVLHIGLTFHTAMSFGTAQQVVGLVILLFACWQARSWPTIGCLINILMVGLYSDLMFDVVPQPDLLALRIIEFVVGVLLCGYGAGIYISAQLGAGPRDWLMLTLHAKTGMKIRWMRTILEVSAVAAGYLLGGPLGAGTIVFSLTVGHPTEWGIKWATRVFRPFVERREASHEIVH